MSTLFSSTYKDFSNLKSENEISIQNEYFPNLTEDNDKMIFKISKGAKSSKWKVIPKKSSNKVVSNMLMSKSSLFLNENEKTT